MKTLLLALGTLLSIHVQVMGQGQLPLDLLEKRIKVWVADTKNALRAG
jgi:uncharacterized protein (DUF885 family)